ncbi:MAG: hypothetical protein HYV20_13095 [Gemmatimonadetes bacterium]|nr:hypothetical protein [Gemmatimonadota bacterium]
MTAGLWKMSIIRDGGIAMAVLGLACGMPEQAPLPPHSFAFGVFGDGPYRAWEMGRFRRVIEDANRADLQWFLHVGDILWYPCSNDAYMSRLAGMNAIRHPVIYTPGDNEWADCHEDIAGGYRPLDRLRQLRATFFANPGMSLGGRTMSLATQSQDSAFTEFVENVRWRFGGCVFAALHMVGSGNASRPFEGRTSADDDEVVARTSAVLAWMEETFRIAQSEGLKGVVLALHGDPGLEDYADQVYAPYRGFVQRLEDLVKGFAGQVLLIHGDSHELLVDHPLRDRTTGQPLSNFTRLETYGAPDIGWVRVVVDSVAGRIVEFEPRLVSRWLLW